MAVRCDVDVGRADEFNHLLGADKAIVKHHLRFRSDFLRQRLQLFSMAVALPAKNVGMGRSSNQVHHILVLRQNMRQRWMTFSIPYSVKKAIRR